MAIDAASAMSHMSFLNAAAAQWASVVDPRLSTHIAGMSLGNPIGLAAGYDKSGRAVDGLAALGFGHIEVGSVSIDPSIGNPKPRLWRLPDDEAVIVHYGLQNEGSRVVRDRLQKRLTSVPVGVNIVKTNRGIDAPCETSDEILTEYVDAVEVLHDSADYLTLNLSCPNTEDGRDFFSDPSNTRELLERLKDVRIEKPLFLKVSPLGDDAADDALLEAVDPFGFVTGFIFNLAPGVHAELRSCREAWVGRPGALAGRPVSKQQNEKIRSLYQRMDRARYRIVGTGGVSTAEDAYEKIKLGASMVQLLTALVYEGPWVVKRINEGLCELMEKDGVKGIGDVVGVESSRH